MSALQRFNPKILLRVSSSRHLTSVVRTFRQKPRNGDGLTATRGLPPVTGANPAGNAQSKSLLLKPFGFTLLVGGVSFGGCAIWQYESLRRVVIQMKEQGENKPGVGKAGTSRHQINVLWNRLSPTRKVLFGIVGVNLGVLLAWKVRALGNLMVTYFTSSPFKAAPCWSMLLSNWSHYSSMHFFVNMYVLWSFRQLADTFGKEQFVAFYTTAGVFSAFAGYLWKFARSSPAASLGASGAIMAAIGAAAIQFPEARLSIAFVDQIIPHSFSIKGGVAAIVCLDVIGLVRGWKLLDHAGHLGGMLFGLWYSNYGHKWIWAKRERFLKMWHGVRGKP